jgi:plastocyanin
VRRAALAALLGSAALALPAAAAPVAVPVSIQFAAFGPGQVDVLPGETVEWVNASPRRHTVNADDGSFASGDLEEGSRFARTFTDVGAHPYHCTIHPGMVGEVDVREVTLGPLPVAPLRAGERVEFQGRTASPDLPVRIERVDGTGSEVIARATPGPDGAWRASAPATRSGDYRAADDRGTSQSRRLAVTDLTVGVRATRGGVAVTVTPSLPYGRVVLQLSLREHFGWWPERRARLDYVSQAAFRVARPARARVVLVDEDGWTPIATSPVLDLRAGRPGPGRRPS